MIFGIGIDIIETKRLERALQNPRFAEKVFSSAEKEYCEEHGKQKNQSFAARWAAKEAFCKALGTGICGGELNEVEILSGDNGRPYIKLSSAWEKQLPSGAVVHVSLSHVKEYATAECIIEIFN